MSLAKLEVSNLRNIETASLTPAARLNFIVGCNGSGKTSLLEAIHILGRARSFRSLQTSQVIRFKQEHLTVTGRLLEQDRQLAIGVRLARRKREIALAGRKLQTSAELIRAFPVLLIQPSSSALLDDPPKFRRQFLDWGTFHREPGFLENWRGYARALSQRNALLRAGASRDIEIWNHELSRYGTMVATSRATYAESLRPHFQEAARHFLGLIPFEIRISAGWSGAKMLEEALRDDLAQDLRDGYTHSGPHKGDFSVMADERPARNYLSRGQLKLLVFALLLAQAQLLEESLDARGCVLIDDLASELDADNRARLLQFLQLRRAQFFITTTDPGIIPLPGGEDGAVFHMDHGKVTKV
ncbi:MAG: DNA replication/repair protein RecF [Methylococcaceae bacterium]|nr:DNA replication/repair protein RecF [Methylococcaceae bacterium]